VGLAAVLVVGAGGLALLTPWRTRALPPAEVRPLVADRPSAAEYRLIEYQNGEQTLALTLRDGGQTRRLTTAADPATLAWLAERGIPGRRVVQGPDFTFADPSPLPASLAIGGLLTGAFLLLRWSRASRGRS
jgi:hypothetical protein